MDCSRFMSIDYKLKAQFFPTTAGQEGFIGSASITVADAVMIRGIAVFQNDDTQDLTICFPTFGRHRQSYILPLDQTAYNRMHRLIEKAAANQRHHTAEIQGSADIALSVSYILTDSGQPEAHYAITIPDFCRLNGITAEETPYMLPNGQKVAVHMPSLTPDAGEGSPVQPFTVFHGLLAPSTLPDGTQVLKDYQKVIDDLVRAKREELLQNRIGPDRSRQENSLPLQNQPTR